MALFSETAVPHALVPQPQHNYKEWAQLTQVCPKLEKKKWFNQTPSLEIVSSKHQEKDHQWELKDEIKRM